MGTCALPGGRSATNATNPGVEVGSSTQQEAGEAMPGEVGGVAGSFSTGQYLDDNHEAINLKVKQL